MTTKKAPVTKGLHAYRFKQNPEELRFALAWLKENSRENGTPLLAYLLNDGANQHRPEDPSERDQVTAATVIQWLGSPVGQGWLRDLGYEKKDAEDIDQRSDAKHRQETQSEGGTSYIIGGKS